jgi:predicted dehydrogenase
MSDLPVGIGIVGYGMIGKVHTFAHRSLPLFYDPLPIQTRLVGVCTTRRESAEKAKAQAGFEFATTDPAELLAHPDITVVHCCTPNDAHHDFLLAAIRAGKHIYCDKPLTRTLHEAESVCQEAEAHPNRIYRMTFNYRFAPATLRAKQLVAEGFLGEIYQFRGLYLHAGYIDPNRPRTWRTQKEKSGGGAIMDLGVHVFDLMRWLVGEMTVVSAQLTTRIPERPDTKTGALVPVDVDDIAIAQVRTESGAIGVIEASRLATGVQDELRFEIHGSKGAIAWNLMDPDFLTVYDARIPEGPLGGSRGPQRIECVTRYPRPYAFGGTKNTLGWPQLHVHCLYDFITVVAGGADNGPTFADGLAAQRFVHQCQSL